jgi:hypothetical protein
LEMMKSSHQGKWQNIWYLVFDNWYFHFFVVIKENQCYVLGSCVYIFFHILFFSIITTLFCLD